MIRRRFSRHAASLAALTVAVLAYLASPPAPRAQSAADPSCNIDNMGNICKIQEDCVWIIFYKKCTKEYWRQPVLDDPGGGDDDEDEDGNPKPT